MRHRGSDREIAAAVGDRGAAIHRRSSSIERDGDPSKISFARILRAVTVDVVEEVAGGGRANAWGSDRRERLDTRDDTIVLVVDRLLQTAEGILHFRAIAAQIVEERLTDPARGIDMRDLADRIVTERVGPREIGCRSLTTHRVIQERRTIQDR